MRQEQSDWQLLKEYVEQGSQEAFAILVERHVNFVYSTCLREVHDAVLAEDVTQVVFLILARKAPGLRETGTLSGWLYKTSCFASKNALKQERGRQRREQNVMQEIIAETSNGTVPDDGWSQMEDQLHDALSSLNKEQQNIIFLRFFEGKSVRETGAALGITEKAAERRLARALEKMRHTFEKSGSVVSILALATLLTDNAVQAAPAHCTATVLQLANTVAAGGTVAGTAIGSTASSLAGGSTTANVVSLSQGVLKAMLISQIKTGVVASLAVSMMATSTVKFAHFARASQPHQEQDSVSPTPVKVRSAPTQAPSTTGKKSLIKPTAAPRVAQIEKAPLPDATTSPLPKRPEVIPTASRPAPRLAQVRSGAISEKQPAKTASVPDDVPKPNAGEIAIEGTISNIGNGRFIVEVALFTLPNGKTSAITPPKPKIVLIDKKTVIHERGNATLLVPFKGLREGASALVIGTDKGSGEALPARTVAVWDSVENGVYRWKGEWVDAPEKTAPPATPEVVANADVPPDDEEQRKFPNQFPQGDFQKTVAGVPPSGWIKNPSARARVLEKNGKRWLAVSSATKGWGTINADVTIKPGWERLRISAQMRAKNLARGEAWWHAARLDFNFYDAENNVLQYGRGLNLYESGGWKKLSHNIAVPKGATRMRLEAGLFFSTGELLLDNIRIEANAPFDARPLRPGFPEGKFETIEKTGWPEGFDPWTPDNAHVVEENGNHFVRINCKPPAQSNAFDGRFALPEEWKRVRVRAKVRLQEYKPGKSAWETAKIGIGAEDEMGKQAGGYLTSAEVKANNDWTTVEAVNPIPVGAKILRLQPQIMGASGILDVDDIEVMDATDEDLPHFPIVEGLPGGTFEELDERGWAKGWIKEAGKPENFEIAEEDGNHFLRMTSGQPIYAASKGRFKLPEAWRGIRVRGRIRVKDLKKKPNAQGWETTRVGFIFQNKAGQRAGGFQQSLELHSDSDWKQLEVKADIPRDAVYIELAVLLNEAAGIFDVDDIKLEEAKPERVLTPFYEWTRTFPEGSFDHLDDQGNPLNWPLGANAQIGTEDGNNFLHLTNTGVQSTVLSSSQWKVKPEWKAVRVRARMRANRLKFGTNPLDGARLQILFLDATENVLNPLPAPLELKRDADWKDLQTQCPVPAGAVAIKLMVALARTSGTLDVDDILIEPLDTP